MPHGPCDERTRSRGTAIVFVSGKRGVGKSNLALNIGMRLARRAQRVILLDADFGFAKTDLLPNATPPAGLTDLLDHRRPVRDLLVDAPGGLRVLCGLSGRRGNGRPELGPQDCARALKRLRGACDLLLVDCGAGLDSTIVSFGLASDLLVVTTTPQPAALADSYAVLKMLCQRGFSGRVGVVVNMARSRREAAAVARRLALVAGRFLGLSPDNLGFVPLDRHVPRAVRARVPVSERYPRCAASLGIEEISMKLGPPLRASRVAPSLWSRVAGVFL